MPFLFFILDLFFYRDDYTFLFNRKVKQWSFRTLREISLRIMTTLLSGFFGQKHSYGTYRASELINLGHQLSH